MYCTLRQSRISLYLCEMTFGEEWRNATRWEGKCPKNDLSTYDYFLFFHSVSLFFDEILLMIVIWHAFEKCALIVNLQHFFFYEKRPPEWNSRQQMGFCLTTWNMALCMAWSGSQIYFGGTGFSAIRLVQMMVCYRTHPSLKSQKVLKMGQKMKKWPARWVFQIGLRNPLCQKLSNG